MKIIKEFKEFAVKGNVLDLAVGVVIAGAFGKIVTSLVNDIIMPLISVLTGGVNFTDLKVIFVAKTDTVAEVSLKYGNFIQNVIDFTIIAFCIFLVIKLLNKMKRKAVEVPVVAPVVLDKSLEILKEIRDSLKRKEK